MTESTNPSATTARHVLLFVPNLIGYGRISLTMASLLLWFGFPRDDTMAFVGMGLYFASFAGDLVDGWIARRLHQTSNMGGVLDMVTDRCSTLGLLIVLVSRHASDTSAADTAEEQRRLLMQLVYAGLAILDVASHWCQMHSTLLLGQHHHKSDQGNEGRHFLVRWFYKYYWFFGYLCVGAELTYIVSLALWHLPPTDLVALWLMRLRYLLLPGCIAKQFVNLMQLTSSFEAIARYDADLYNAKGKTS